jgi:hypothetical protein
MLSNLANDVQVKSSILPKAAVFVDQLNPLFQITEDVGSNDGNKYVFLVHCFHINIIVV